MAHSLPGAERADPLQGKPVPRRRLVGPELPKQDTIQYGYIFITPSSPFSTIANFMICGDSECLVFLF